MFLQNKRFGHYSKVNIAPAGFYTQLVVLGSLNLNFNREEALNITA